MPLAAGPAFAAGCSFEPQGEGRTGIFGRRRRDAERGASADAVIGGLGIDHRLQPEKRQQLAVKIPRNFEIRGGQKNMRDAVDFHRLPLRGVFG